MLTGALTFLLLIVAFVTLVALCTAWAVTVLQVAAVPDDAWREARDDRRTWLMVVVLGGPVGALAFWLTTWPQLAAARRDLPVVPSSVSAVLGDLDGGAPAPVEPPADASEETAPARKAPAKKAAARKAPAAKAPARKSPTAGTAD